MMNNGIDTTVFTHDLLGSAAVRQLRAGLAAGQVVLGLDSGKKRWGIAVSDDSLSVSLPLVQYDRQKYGQDIAFLAQLINERSVGGIIIGMPLHMDGSQSPRGQAAVQLGKDISQRLKIGVAFWDERLSSVAMEREMIVRGDLSRRKRQQSLDKLAATYILQGALDSLFL